MTLYATLLVSLALLSSPLADMIGTLQASRAIGYEARAHRTERAGLVRDLGEVARLDDASIIAALRARGLRAG